MPTTLAAQSQKQVVQATAEQMQFAQVIFDKNDSDFEAKVKQLMEMTGKNQDECIVALHDCNANVNNLLLEGNSDTTSWETVGGKKNFGRDNSENKENNEKRTEIEASHGWGNNNHKGRCGNQGQEFKGEENGIALKETSLWSKDLDVAGAEGQEGSLLKARDIQSCRLFRVHVYRRLRDIVGSLGSCSERYR